MSFYTYTKCIHCLHLNLSRKKSDIYYNSYKRLTDTIQTFSDSCMSSSYIMFLCVVWTWFSASECSANRVFTVSFYIITLVIIPTWFSSSSGWKQYYVTWRLTIMLRQRSQLSSSSVSTRFLRHYISGRSFQHIVL